MRKLGFGRGRGRAAVVPANAPGPRPAPRIPPARALRRPAPCAMRHGGFMVLVDSPAAFFSNLLEPQGGNGALLRCAVGFTAPPCVK